MKKKFSEGKPYKVIALCLTKFKDYDQIKVMKELCNHCAEEKIKIMIFTSVTDLVNGGINDIGEGHVFSLFDVERFDAIVMMSATFKHMDILNNLVNRAIKYQVPIISVDHYIQGCINISFDYGIAFEKIINHLVETHQFTDIKFLAGEENYVFSEERIAFFRKTLKENHINTIADSDDFWSDSAEIEIERMLEQGELPQAIVCAGDYVAIECMRTLKKHGIQVPDQIVVTGFDGVEIEKYYSPRLTTAEFDVSALRNAIFQAVFDNADGKRMNKDIEIDYINRIGASCGCNNLPTENVEERLYTQKIKNDNYDFYIQGMYNMIAKLSNYPDLHYIFDMIPDYFRNSKIQECWMCFNDDFLDEKADIKTTFNREEDDYSKYTDSMRIPMHSKEQEMVDQQKCKVADLLPNIEEVLENNEYLMIVPVHLQGFTVGYIGNTFDVNSFEFSYYQTFLLNFRHILEIYVNRTTQARLYVCDVLTHIYNRHGFYRNIGEHLKKSSKHMIPFTVISIDLDGLKYINDTYGHAEGDLAIKTMAECMMMSTNRREICSRFGGDEFVIAFTSENSESRAKEIIESIENKLEIYNSIGDKPYQIKASFGSFSKIATKKETLDDYIKLADDFMYKEKQNHKEMEKNIRTKRGL